MKTYKIILVSILAGLLYSGCQKDILNQTPETSINDAEFWKSADDLKLYANSFYNNMLPNYNGWGSIGIYGLDAGLSDDMIGTSYNSALNGERTVPSGGGGYGAYGDWWSLRNVNYLLANTGKITESFDVYKRYVGEALFFRAYFYYQKLRQFGDLPWISRVLTPASPELAMARLPRNIVADSILYDLDQAISYLPTKGQAGTSRINKQIALLFQARIALYEGTWEKYHAGTPFGVSGSTGQKYLQKAADASKALMDNSDGYDLVALPGKYGYWELFNQVNYSGNSEVMLWRQFVITLNGGHRWHRYSNSGGGRGLTRDLMEAYLCTDGKPISISPLYMGDASLLDVVTNRDPRLRQTIYVPDGEHIVTNNRPGGAAPVLFENPTFEVANEGKSLTGYQIYKGHNPDYTQQQDQGTTGQIIFRYAEALMIYAEARAELGLFNQQDADLTVNRLRARVGMPGMDVAAITVDPKAEFPEISPLLNEIRRERRVEFACEGYRADDLYRWAAVGHKLGGKRQLGAKRAQWEQAGVPAPIAEAVLAFPVDDNGYIDYFKNVTSLAGGYLFNEARDYLAPLPLDQMQLNPNLKQNPGW